MWWSTESPIWTSGKAGSRSACAPRGSGRSRTSETRTYSTMPAYLQSMAAWLVECGVT